ncbi:transcriptional regulator [Virgisporangium aliadipatigenens]|uniref:Transcriptional regulator n=1 Tax=Virgisporangium aliadipatigenens TaxID=741659 RepID=A0A8J3YX91_9ACTN|nr:transcriptional regulator [Virgisporangium aliadipatigenens]
MPPGRSGPTYRGGRPRPRWGRIFLVSGVVLLVLALIGAGGAYTYYQNLNNDVRRTDAFAGITGGRPAKTVDGALNILMLGSDSRDPENADKPGNARTDTLIVAHIPASHDKAYLISMPRDLYVPIPKDPKSGQGGGKAKINAAFAWGGIPLVVRTVEGYTGLRLDHVVLIDFGGFTSVVDALGGVDLNIEQDVKSIHQPFRQFKKGVMHLDGAAALDYARQRKQFPEGDFARMRHQQELMKAIMDKAVSGGTLSNPMKLNSFLKAATKAVTVDQDLSPVDLALQFRNIRSQDLTFSVSPHQGSKIINGEDVVVPDETKAKGLYEAIKNDKAGEWFAANPPPAK